MPKPGAGRTGNPGFRLSVQVGSAGGDGAFLHADEDAGEYRRGAALDLHRQAHRAGQRGWQLNQGNREEKGGLDVAAADRGVTSGRCSRSHSLAADREPMAQRSQSVGR